ncbi:MAG: hypothetical protein KGI33_12130 [Thaumarchaeota archaeon]|nr:hypothetical protein [Nitrososphaerota archaeon]
MVCALGLDGRQFAAAGRVGGFLGTYENPARARHDISHVFIARMSGGRVRGTFRTRRPCSSRGRLKGLYRTTAG